MADGETGSAEVETTVEEGGREGSTVMGVLVLTVVLVLLIIVLTSWRDAPIVFAWIFWSLIIELIIIDQTQRIQVTNTYLGITNIIN